MKIIKIQRNLLAITSSILVLANLFMAIKLSKQKNLTILVPTLDRQIIIGENYVSNDYLQLRTDQIADLLFNIREDNCNKNKEQLLRQVNSSRIEEFKHKIDEFIDDIRKKKYYYVLHKQKYDIDNQELSVIISGELETYLAGKKISQEFKTYKFSYENQSGILSLISFQELTNSKQDKDKKNIEQEAELEDKNLQERSSKTDLINTQKQQEQQEQKSEVNLEQEIEDVE